LIDITRRSQGKTNLYANLDFNLLKSEFRLAVVWSSAEMGNALLE